MRDSGGWADHSNFGDHSDNLHPGAKRTEGPCRGDCVDLAGGTRAIDYRAHSCACKGGLILEREREVINERWISSTLVE